MREDNRLIFDLDNMIKFYHDLDPIELKYKEYIKEKPGRYEQCYRYEDSHYLGEITKMDYARILANGELVYGDKEKFKRYVELIEYVSDRLIGRYLAIFAIIALGVATPEELGAIRTLAYKVNDVLREFYIHQIRDAYMMHRMLEEDDCEISGEISEAVSEALLQEKDSKLSRYIRRILEQQLNAEDGFQRNIEINEEEKRAFYLRNIVLMSSYMAGLFHDIGYPESFYKVSSDHIRGYIPEVWSLNGGGANIAMVQSMLSNSLLFRVVPGEEIVKRLMDYDSFKYDHGALSAVIFLMHFYESGTIYGLEPYKAAAVELAGLAIYNHTNKYDIIDGKNTAANRPTFHENPIAYLLRVCDDMQEWDRLYFLITGASNIVICEECKAPVIRKEGEWKYACNCRRNRGIESIFTGAFIENNAFPSRRVYNLQVCDSVSVYKENEGKKRYTVELNYSLQKLLHASFINPDFAKYRINELNKLKKLLSSQDGLPEMKLRYFVTSNPYKGKNPLCLYAKNGV